MSPRLQASRLQSDLEQILAEPMLVVIVVAAE